MPQIEELRPAAQPAPQLSRAARRRMALAFGGIVFLCLGLLVTLFLLTRAVPNGRVGTGPYNLVVENGLGEAICAVHIGEAGPSPALSRNKLGSGVLRVAARFELTGLEARPYALRAWTCDGRPTRVVDVDPSSGETTWRVTSALLDVP